MDEPGETLEMDLSPDPSPVKSRGPDKGEDLGWVPYSLLGATELGEEPGSRILGQSLGPLQSTLQSHPLEKVFVGLGHIPLTTSRTRSCVALGGTGWGLSCFLP